MAAPPKLAPLRVMYAIRGMKLPRQPQMDCQEKEQLWELCKKCWTHDPLRRLTIEDAISSLDAAKPYLGSPSSPCGLERTSDIDRSTTDHGSGETTSTLSPGVSIMTPIVPSEAPVNTVVILSPTQVLTEYEESVRKGHRSTYLDCNNSGSCASSGSIYVNPIKPSAVVSDSGSQVETGSSTGGEPESISRSCSSS